jgi:hypothetical protein
MQRSFKQLGNRLLILSVMGIAINTPLGNFSPQQSFKENNAGNIVNLDQSSLATPHWVIGARDDRKRECRFLGICDT